VDSVFCGLCDRPAAGECTSCRFDVLVDFRAGDGRGNVVACAEFTRAGVDPSVGAVLIACDYGANRRALSIVVGHDPDDTVLLYVARDAFLPAPPGGADCSTPRLAEAAHRIRQHAAARRIHTPGPTPGRPTNLPGRTPPPAQPTRSDGESR
jgi:hypothetical protein